MKQISALITVVALSVGPAMAQEGEERGSDLMERGMELLLDGLREEMSPALKHMRQMAEDYGPALFSFLDEMGPAFAEMLNSVRDWTDYEPPEMLPNGDIVIRKKTTPLPKPEPEPKAEPESDELRAPGETEI